MRRRRVIGGLVALALVAIVAYSWATMRPDVTAADVNRIRIGMTLAEVERLFGPPDQIDPRSKSAPAAGAGAVPFGQLARWNAPSGGLVVVLEHGVVVFVEFQEGPARPPKSIYVRFMH